MRKFSVHYRGDLNGGGTIEAPWFVRFLRQRFPERRFERVLDWCGGCGFLGFSLLDAGLCEELCIVDVNPDAIACVERTLAENREALGDHRVTARVSDNLSSLSEGEQFDLVVGKHAYHVPGDPRGVWDVRPRPPIQDFRAQIEAGGLGLRDVAHPEGSLRWFWILLSERV